MSVSSVQTNPIQIEQKNTVTVTTKLAEPTNFIQHSPINITNNYELASIAQTGNGIKISPYIIENMLITSCITGIFDRTKTAIQIFNTTAYFKLKNVKIEGCHTAIMFGNVEHGSVADSIITSFSNGIWAEYSSELQFTNLTFKYNIGYGLYFVSVQNFTVRNSHIEAGMEGINIENSNYGNLANNTIIGLRAQDNFYGLDLRDSYYFTIANNTCSDCATGFYLDQSNRVNVTNNIALYNDIGIRLESSGANILTNNMVNTTTNDGLELISSNLNNLTENTVLNSQRYGFGLYGADNNRLINNTSKGSLLSDYHEEDSKHNVFIGNTFKKGSSLNPIILDVVSILMVLAVLSSLGLVIVYKRYQKRTNLQLIHKTFRQYLKDKILRTKKK